MRIMTRPSFAFAAHLWLVLLVGPTWNNYRNAAAAFGVIPVFASVAATGATSETLSTKDVVSKVAVAGATGRTGRLVVQELLDRGVGVVALVRDLDKAKEVLPDPPPSSLNVVRCDLAVESEISSAASGCDAAIWCATGFSDSPGSSVLQRVKKLFGFAVTPKRTIDAVGIPALAKVFATSNDSSTSLDPNAAALPKFVMLSSAGVTRPGWDDEKKALFPGSADIPIVRLNPFGILNIKAESEEKLRQCGVDYCIVRPAGLNDKWPAGSRPIISQGDVAVGRINRKDVAAILVDVLSTAEASGKTFEVIALAGYSPAASISTVLSRLSTDHERGRPSSDEIFATYNAMQQLLPGEKQDSASLAMGQTYEELDKGETGRLGKRGEENAEAAAPKPTT